MMKLTPSDHFWISLTTYYEARGESAVGQRAVAKVILNRAMNKSASINSVVFKPAQFSCYNAGLDSPYLHIKNITLLSEIFKVCQEAFEEWLSGDDLKGATHYFAIKGMEGGKAPYWASSMTFICEIGGHKFFRED